MSPEPTPGAASVTVSGDLISGGEITVSGAGFAPHVLATVELHSEPVVLGTVMTDAHGSFTLDAVIPAGIPVGSHRIVVLVDGEAVGTVPVTVTAAPIVKPTSPVTSSTPTVSVSAGLPRTGSALDVLPLWIGVGAALAGLVLVARRRSQV